MRWNQTLIRTVKETPKGEEAKNAQLLIRAGFIDKLSAGVYTYLPLGLLVLNKIADLIRKHINSSGGVELLMPSLHTKEAYLKTNRWDNFNCLIHFNTNWTKSEYALGATHEEIITPLAKKYIQSYKDLPMYLYQIQDKFRDEKRAKSGLLRGREFIMKDLYSFHASEIDLDEYYEKIKKVYSDIFTEVGLGGITYLTFASGGTFSKYSHEFQTVCASGEDTIYLCEHCGVAVNKEIIKEQPSCPKCNNKKLNETKSIEVGNIFKLMTKFSEPFNLDFMDEAGKRAPVVMGCYGIGLGRLMGTVAEALSDDSGLIWPEAIAPFRVHLIGLNLEDKEIKKQADGLYEKLVKAKIDVLYDDRGHESAGIKFADADIIGCPLRITVSKRTVDMKKIEVKNRLSQKVELVEQGDIDKVVNFSKSGGK